MISRTNPHQAVRRDRPAAAPIKGAGGDAWELVVLDFDGTLADSFPWFASVLNDAAHRFRFRPVAPAEHPALRRMSAGEVFAHLGIPPWKVPLVAAHLRRRTGREIERILPFPSVDAVLAHLAGQGLRLALASSNSLGNVRGVLGPASLARFERIECGIPVAGKGTRLRRILRRTGAPAGSAIYVGDEVRDIAAARAAGMAAGAVTWGYNDAEVLRAAGPDRMFASVAELCSLAPQAQGQPGLRISSLGGTSRRPGPLTVTCGPLQRYL